MTIETNMQSLKCLNKFICQIDNQKTLWADFCKINDQANLDDSFHTKLQVWFTIDVEWHKALGRKSKQ